VAPGIGDSAVPQRGLRIALHAQVSPEQGFIVGSVITTAGKPMCVYQTGSSEAKT
jgi:hypothetical protein